MKNKRNNGITLIALVVTIIVLLILAGISISMLTGNNGILKRAENVKDETIVGKEKEEIALTYNSLVMDDVTQETKITDKRFEDEINKNRSSNDVLVDVDLQEYIVYYKNTKHTYLVDKNGNIALIDNIEPTEIIYVALKGDTLTFSNNIEDLGTLDIEPYLINKGTIFNDETTIPWKNERYQIKYVDFINKIIPLNTKNWFNGCNNLIEIKHMENLNTSKVTNMSKMFYGNSKLRYIDLTHFSTKNVVNFQNIFTNCSSLTSIDVSFFDTSNARTLGGMFSGCYNLTSLDVSNFDTSKVTEMWSMFMGCRKLTSLDLSSFNTCNVKMMNAMFSSWLDDGSRLGDGMALTTIYIGEEWTTSLVTESTEMFIYCFNIVGGNGTTYNSSKTDIAYAKVDGGPSSSTPGYFTYKNIE